MPPTVAVHAALCDRCQTPEAQRGSACCMLELLHHNLCLTTNDKAISPAACYLLMYGREVLVQWRCHMMTCLHASGHTDTDFSHLRNPCQSDQPGISYTTLPPSSNACSPPACGCTSRNITRSLQLVTHAQPIPALPRTSLAHTPPLDHTPGRVTC
jgi:hypothetical protein